MIASGPISSGASRYFSPSLLCIWLLAIPFPGSHLVVTTYVLKRAIRHLMYGEFSGWPLWCSKPFVEMQRLPPSAGGTACRCGCPLASWEVYEPSWGVSAELSPILPVSPGTWPQSEQGSGSKNTCLPVPAQASVCLPGTHFIISAPTDPANYVPGAGDSR